MGRPNITEDQRAIVVTLLANAIRKDAHLRARARHAREDGNPLTTVTAGRRSESSQRYVEGMRDLLRVLFAEGSPLAEECLEEAYTLTIGVGRSTPFSNNGKTFQ